MEKDDLSRNIVFTSNEKHMDPPHSGAMENCVSGSQVEFAAAVAFLVGSPLQKSQPTAIESIQPSLLIAQQLLEYGVDPERVIRLISS